MHLVEYKPISDEMFSAFIEWYERGYGIGMSNNFVVRRFGPEAWRSSSKWGKECRRRGYQLRKNNIQKKIMRLIDDGFCINAYEQKRQENNQNLPSRTSEEMSFKEKIYTIVATVYGGNQAFQIPATYGQRNAKRLRPSRPSDILLSNSSHEVC